MTLLPLRQGCALLGIDPKTLRHWVQQANLSVHPHPSDARVKCVTSEHIERLAALHHRPLDLPAVLAQLHPGEACPALLPEKPAPQVEPDLLSKLAQLETQVALVQQQLAGLALELLQERTQRYEQRLHTLEARIQLPAQHNRSVSVLPSAHEQRSQPDKPLKTPRAHPAKGRPRAILPLIEYTADGTYIVICPQQGELALIPDSPAWFAWLETVSSLRAPRVSRGVGAPTATKGGHPAVGLPIAV
jgi:DNA-binding transcriptional MerR regulator